MKFEQALDFMRLGNSVAIGNRVFKLNGHNFVCIVNGKKNPVNCFYVYEILSNEWRLVL